MKRNYLIPIFFIFCTTLLAQKVVNPQDKKAVLDLMEAQENAWNEGDLDRFMLGYWQNEALVFVGRTGPTYGYANTLAKYRKGYPDKEAMGTLSFDLLHLQQWDASTLQLIGKFTLIRTKDQPTGYFTLLFRKIEGQWKIVSDHTS